MFKWREFDMICQDVTSCRLCPRMLNSARILNGSVGPLDAKIMFIGEAPGRLGADDTGIPFHGDKSGHNFEELLKFSGISRNSIYVTNAVLCNPKDQKGNNATPNKKEISNCSNYLKRQMDLVDPQIVVTLGAKALEATRAVDEHTLSLRESVRQKINWHERILIPLYHPGQRAMIHRSFANQRSDYQFVAETFSRINKKKRSYKTTVKTELDVSLIVEYLLKLKPVISYFALHKLFYLIEYHGYKQFGKRITGSYIVRQKDGPYCTDLHIKKLENSIPDLKCKWHKNGSFEISKPSLSLFTNTLLNEYEIHDDILGVVDFVVSKYGGMTKFELKKNVYLTRPMRNLMRLEQEKKMNLYNTPIYFEERVLN